ncbi:hypothetical protein SARC_16425, partial [Sphaeroforma arctica JP610]
SSIHLPDESGTNRDILSTAPAATKPTVYDFAAVKRLEALSMITSVRMKALSGQFTFSRAYSRLL